MSEYSAQVRQLIEQSEICPLGPGKPDQAVFATLERMRPEDLSGSPIADRSMANACLSGLWLLYNHLERSHEISQAIKNETGSYWHGIMHRREPDYSNAKYWFRQTGNHPAMDELNATATKMAQGETLDDSTQFLTEGPDWDPYAMVDACQSAESGRSRNRELLQKIADQEWKILFDYCFRHAF